MTSYEDILVKVSYETLDFDHVRWPVEEIYDYISEGQKEYARVTGCLVANSIVVGNADGVYSVPDDFIRPLEFRNIDDKLIKQYSLAELDQLYGAKWLTNKGEIPEGVCFDYGTYGTFNLIPFIPAEKIAGTLSYVRLPSEDYVEVDDDIAILNYVLCRLYEAEKDKRFIKKFLTCGNEFNKRLAYKAKKTANRAYPKGRYY